MIRLSFSVSSVLYTLSFADPSKFSDAWAAYKGEHGFDFDITCHYDMSGSWYMSIVFFAPVELTLSTDDSIYRVDVAKGHAVCLNRSSVNNVAINNELSLVSVSSDGSSVAHFLSYIYADSTITMATAINALIALGYTGIKVTSRISFDFTWEYKDDTAQFIVVDHDLTIDNYLISPSYISLNALSELESGKSYTQSITLKYLDYLNKGVAPNSDPILTSVTGSYRMEKSSDPIEITLPAKETQGEKIHFCLHDNQLVAEFMTIDEFLDSEMSVVDLMLMANEFYANPRMTFGSRCRILYKDELYNAISTPYTLYMQDIAAELVTPGAVNYSHLTSQEMIYFLTSYVYINRAMHRVQQMRETTDTELFNTYMNQAQECLTIASNATTELNKIDIANLVIQLTNELFALMLDRMN